MNIYNNNNNKQRYDVFLSFRGADTRLRFTAHLHDALVKANIETFLDDKEIETGEDLRPELENAIKSARASIIVLSENYATSTWCLDELVLILDQRRVFHHIVIPIFYDVEPTDVRKQKKSFGVAMTKHRQKMDAETNAEKKVKWGEKIDRWIKALTEVADLKGKDVKGRREPDFIEEIVTEISQRLGVPLSGTLPVLIGRNHQIEEITSWLTDGSSSHTADIFTVLGMGGIGKTSLAKYVFHLHSRTFDKSSFIEGISLRCTGKSNELLDVQKQLSDVISKKNKLQVKVFLVLDDIDSLEQLDALLGNQGFHPGSKILITTKDASLTERCALFKSKVKPKHKNLLINGLNEPSALELLCLHAFNSEDPKAGYEEVIGKVVMYCEGHPLALEVLGRSLLNQEPHYWEACIEMLKREPHSRIRKALQMSFDSLPFSNEKELFKHIACFFVGSDREISEEILKACDIETTLGIQHLTARCLLSIGWGNRLMMHQLLQEMGKAVVRDESPNEPWNRSRLWCHDESFKVLKRKKGTGKLIGLVLDTRMLEKEKFCALKTDAFKNMDNLMILQLNYVQLSGSYEDFPEELRWLCMHGFPLKSIPLDIPMENLVVLDMSYSKIESFGTCCTSCNPQPLEGGQKVIGSCSEDKRILGSLKILDLSFCEQLHKLGGFYELPTLERLIARNCICLIEIDELLEECVELVHIDLSYCVKLEKLPTAIRKLKKVEKLLLDGCSISSIVEEIPIHLNLRVIPLPSSLVRLSLANNNLSNESFPMDLSCLPNLKSLCLDKNPIVSMPNCVRSLSRLEELSMANCKTLMSIEHPPCTLRWLIIQVDDFVVLDTYDPDMSPIFIAVTRNSFRPWSFEIEGMLKIQPLEGVEEKVLCSLGWTNLDFLNKRHVVNYWHSRGAEQSQIQMYYEFGIFSTIYGGHAMPDWIRCISSQNPISFTIPPSPNKQLKGLNFCYRAVQVDRFFELPVIEIRNKTKNRSWIYKHCVEKFYVCGEWLTFISHWMFGMNEMEAGDQIIITMCEYRDVKSYTLDLHTKNCGVSIVYDDGSMEDALEYYKSWNQLTNEQYFLSHEGFTREAYENERRFYKYSSKKYKDTPHVGEYFLHDHEGMVKINPLEDVDKKVLCCLGWINLHFLNKRHVVTYHHRRGAEKSQIQMCYEFGIFSTIYEGQAMPGWIRVISSETPIISFTIPSSPYKQLKGLNFCYVLRRLRNGDIQAFFETPADPFFQLPVIEISNKTKNRSWIYKHCIGRFDVGGEWLTFLSHWMFGMNEMEAGDEIIITMIEEGNMVNQLIEKCGVNLVYDYGRMEKDALDYYKAWNHIIGGDLSSFQLPTGEYFLYHHAFTQDENPLFKRRDGQLTENCGVGFVYDDALEYYKSWNHIIGGDLSKFQLTTGEYMLHLPDFTRRESLMGPMGHKVSSKYKQKNAGPFRAFSSRTTTTFKYPIWDDDDNDHDLNIAKKYVTLSLRLTPMEENEKEKK